MRPRRIVSSKKAWPRRSISSSTASIAATLGATSRARSRSVLRQLPLDVVERRNIRREQVQALGHGGEPPVDQVPGHADRIQQLQLQAAGRVERLPDEPFERFEPARGPQVGLALFRTHRRAGAHREDRRGFAEHVQAVGGHEPVNSLEVLRPLDQILLVDDDDNLLPPGPDALEELALRLREGPVDRGDKQHQVRPRHEVRGQHFVLADDGVGARGVDDVDVAEEVDGSREPPGPPWQELIRSPPGRRR